MPEAMGEKLRVVREGFQDSVEIVAGKIAEATESSEKNRPLSKRIRQASNPSSTPKSPH